MTEGEPRIGIGSYAYRYNIGFDGFERPNPMGLIDFIDRAASLGVGGVQLCENLSFAEMDRCSLTTAADRLRANGLFVELGMRDVTVDNLKHHLDLADRLDARFIRLVAGTPHPFPESDRQTMIDRLIGVFEEVLPDVEKSDVSLGLENHYDLPTPDLVSVVERLDHERLGLVFDTTNGLGFVERPEDTLQMMKPHILSMHVKDYIVEKVEAGYLVKGTALGDGLLPWESMVKEVLALRPTASVIVEMTIRRDGGRPPQDIVCWEDEAVARSVATLQSLFALDHVREGD